MIVLKVGSLEFLSDISYPSVYSFILFIYYLFIYSFFFAVVVRE